MNCMEAQALVEDALDASLAGGRKRALDLHLSRCDVCRAFFAAEREEHRRWFQAMNERGALRRLPAGCWDEIASRHAVPQRRWAFFTAFRRVAAAWAAMLLFAGLSYAVVTARERMVGGSKAAPGGETSPSGFSSGSAEVRQAPGDSWPLSLNHNQSQSVQGEAAMTIRNAASAALAATLTATAPVLAYNSLAPHDNTEDTEFWDTRAYDVAPASSDYGVCDTEINRCVRTEAVSQNEIQSFRRLHISGIIIQFR